MKVKSDGSVKSHFLLTTISGMILLGILKRNLLNGWVISAYAEITKNHLPAAKNCLCRELKNCWEIANV